MSVAELDSRRAVAAYLRDLYPVNGAKELSRLLPDVNRKTIEGWFSGEKRPNGTHMDRLIALFGFGFRS